MPQPETRTSEHSEPHQLSVARGTAYGLVADATTVVSVLVVSILVARFLGPENRGVYFLAVLISMFVVILGDMGFSTSGLVFAANRRIPLGHLHGMAAALSVIVATVAGALLLSTADWLTETVLRGVTSDELRLVAIGVAPTLYAQVALATLTGMGRVRTVSALRIAMAVATPFVMLPAVWVSGGSAYWAVFGWLVTAFLLAIGVAVFATRAMGAPAPPSAAESRALLSFGLRAYVGTVSHHGYLRTDVLFISARLGPADVGQYSLASVIAERISLVGSAVYNASASRVGSGDRDLAENLVARTVRILILVIVPAAVLLGLLSWVLIPLAFGADFEPAVLPFVLLLPGTVCLTIWYAVGLFIVAGLHRPGITTVIQGSAMLLALPLYWLAVREWGMTGAAIVSSATYCSVLAAGVVIFLRQRTSPTARLVPTARDLRELYALARTAGATWRARHA